MLIFIHTAFPLHILNRDSIENAWNYKLIRDDYLRIKGVLIQISYLGWAVFIMGMQNWDNDIIWRPR